MQIYVAVSCFVSAHVNSRKGFYLEASLLFRKNVPLMAADSHGVKIYFVNFHYNLRDSAPCLPLREMTTLDKNTCVHDVWINDLKKRDIHYFISIIVIVIHWREFSFASL